MQVFRSTPSCFNELLAAATKLVQSQHLLKLLLLLTYRERLAANICQISRHGCGQRTAPQNAHGKPSPVATRDALRLLE